MTEFLDQIIICKFQIQNTSSVIVFETIKLFKLFNLKPEFFFHFNIFIEFETIIVFVYFHIANKAMNAF